MTSSLLGSDCDLDQNKSLLSSWSEAVPRVRRDAPSLLSGFHPVMRGQGSQVLLDSVGQVDRILRYTNTDGALYLYEEGQYYDQC